MVFSLQNWMPWIFYNFLQSTDRKRKRKKKTKISTLLIILRLEKHCNFPGVFKVSGPSFKPPVWKINLLDFEEKVVWIKLMKYSWGMTL